MSIHVPGLKSIILGVFLHHFVLAKLATASIRIKVFGYIGSLGDITATM